MITCLCAVAAAWARQQGVGPCCPAQGTHPVPHLLTLPRPSHPADIDATGIHFFDDLIDELRDDGVDLVLGNPAKNVLVQLKRALLIRKIGRANIHINVSDAVNQVCLLYGLCFVAFGQLNSLQAADGVPALNCRGGRW